MQQANRSDTHIYWALREYSPVFLELAFTQWCSLRRKKSQVQIPPRVPNLWWEQAPRWCLFFICFWLDQSFARWVPVSGTNGYGRSRFPTARL